jgi:hypothetical protein
MSAHVLSGEAPSLKRVAACVKARPTDGDTDDSELPEPELDETELPALDTEDAEAPMQETPDYRDLLDDDWLERGAEVLTGEDDLTSYVEFGVTIDLNGHESGEDLSQVLELDVGSLLTSLPNEIAELDVDVARDQGQSDGFFAVAALTDVLLPEDGRERSERVEDDLGDDERFPPFEDSLIVARPRPPLDDADDALEDDGP